MMEDTSMKVLWHDRITNSWNEEMATGFVKKTNDSSQILFQRWWSSCGVNNNPFWTYYDFRQFEAETFKFEFFLKTRELVES